MLSVLVVEDTAAWFKVIHNELLKLGIYSDWADSADRALLKLAKPQMKYDLVILDPHLDKDLGAYSGRQVAKALQESTLSAKLLLLSGYMSTADLEDMFGSNPSLIAGYFAKDKLDEDIERFRDTLLKSIMDRDSELGGYSLARLNDLFNDISSQRNGFALEDIAASLFNSMEYIRVVQRNVRTSTGEVDILLQVTTTPNDLALDVGSFVVVECKNRTGKVSARQVAYFVSQMNDLDARIGILICRSGITGNTSLRDARGQITKTRYQHRRIVIVIAGNHISDAVSKNQSFSELLAERYLASITDNS